MGMVSEGGNGKDHVSAVHRPFVDWAAGLMENCLRLNDDRGKGPWETVSVTVLWDKLIEEMLELKKELTSDSHDFDVPRIQAEATDVAVTAMMIAARIDMGDPSRWRRGR